MLLKLIPRYLVFSVVFMALLISCGSSSNDSGSGNFLELNISCPDLEDTQQRNELLGVSQTLEDIVLLVLTITGGTPPIDDIVEEFEPNEQNITVEVPSGTGREFIIMGKDIDNQTICMGSDIVDVTFETTSVDLNCVFVFEICDDGIDNDLDDLIDCSDPECDTSSCSASGQCSGGVCQDPGDDDDDDNDEVPEEMEDNFQGECQDFEDNDNDGVTDCDDPDCENAPVCQPPPPPPPDPEPSSCVPDDEIEGDCSDNKDNDCNGLTDCADPECEIDPDCCEPQEGEICDNNIDDDCNGDIDCNDSDCICNETDCSPVPSSCFIGKPGFCVQ